MGPMRCISRDVPRSQVDYIPAFSNENEEPVTGPDYRSEGGDLCVHNTITNTTYH